MLIGSVSADPLRSLTQLEIELAAGATAICGPNGAGKTNLLEALYFALTGRSFRTADRREMIPFGASYARAGARVEDGEGLRRAFTATVSRSEGRRHLLDGNPVDAATAARYRPHVLVFSPDRLSLIKGPPGERRAHLDAFLGARRPFQGDLRRRYGQTLAQRNAMLGRLASGTGSGADLDAWDSALAASAAPLIEAREAAVADLGAPFARAATELGLPGEAEIVYAPRARGPAADLAEAFRERRAGDLHQGRTGTGPHLDEVKIDLDGHSLRRYGSQGQQRLGLLALLFAEREALAGSWARPVLLLDDVLSELDGGARERLGERLRAGGQSLITAVDASLLPDAVEARIVGLGGA